MFVWLWRLLFINIAALEEAKDIVRYLKPLQKHFKLLEETDFGDIAVCLSPLMHVVCLVWSNSRFYRSSGKIIVLLKEICNLLIAQVSVYWVYDYINLLFLCNNWLG